MGFKLVLAFDMIAFQPNGYWNPTKLIISSFPTCSGVGEWTGGGKLILKLNSVQLELRLGLSLAIIKRFGITFGKGAESIRSQQMLFTNL